MDTALQFVKYAAKAVLSALAVVIAFLATILSGDQTLADVTFVQWLLCTALVLSTFGFVYKVPNGLPPNALRPTGEVAAGPGTGGPGV